MENKVEKERQKRNEKRDYLLEFYYDDIALSKEFESSVIQLINNCNLDVKSIIKEFDSIDMYKLNTTLSQDKTIKIAQNFFNEINPDFCNYFMMRIHDKSGISIGNNPNVNVETRDIELTSFGDLRDLYTIVHEFSHLFDSTNGDTATRNVLTESIAQSMERLLDTYLLNLDDSSLVMYGIDKKILQDDIDKRNISTYIQRLKSVRRVEKAMPDFGRKALESGYMLAQIYSTEFSTLSFDKQKTTIANLIDCAARDDFDEAINIYGIDISKDNLDRTNIIDKINEKNVGYYNNMRRAKMPDEKIL